MKNAQKSQIWRSGGISDGDRLEVDDVERRRVAEALPPEEAGRVEEVERDDREQHHDGARERVEEELDRRVELPRPAPDPDEEVHRDEHDLPEHVEEEEVEGAEDADHPRLEEEEERVVLLLALRDRRERRVHGDEREERRQEDEERRDAVHAEGVLRAERGDPVVRLAEEEVARRPEPREGPQRDREEELGAREERRDPADEARLLARHEEDREGPRDRQEDEQREESVHAAPFFISGGGRDRRIRKRRPPWSARSSACARTARGASRATPFRACSRRRSPRRPRTCGRTRTRASRGRS